MTTVIQITPAEITRLAEKLEALAAALDNREQLLLQQVLAQAVTAAESRAAGRTEERQGLPPGLITLRSEPPAAPAEAAGLEHPNIHPPDEAARTPEHLNTRTPEHSTAEGTLPPITDGFERAFRPGAAASFDLSKTPPPA